jgi:hypothetical protein
MTVDPPPPSGAGENGSKSTVEDETGTAPDGAAGTGVVTTGVTTVVFVGGVGAAKAAPPSTPVKADAQITCTANNFDEYLVINLLPPILEL